MFVPIPEYQAPAAAAARAAALAADLACPKKTRFWGFGLPQAAFVIATALLLQKAEIDNEGPWEHWSST